MGATRARPTHITTLSFPLSYPCFSLTMKNVFKQVAPFHNYILSWHAASRHTRARFSLIQTHQSFPAEENFQNTWSGASLFPKLIFCPPRQREGTQIILSAQCQAGHRQGMSCHQPLSEKERKSGAQPSQLQGCSARNFRNEPESYSGQQKHCHYSQIHMNSH